MNIVIPMSGAGRRFIDAGYADPKPFILVNGLPMIERVVENVRPKNRPASVFCMVRSEHMQRAKEVLPNENYFLVEVKGLTQGAACTVLLAADYIDSNESLMICNSDQLVAYDIDRFIDKCEHRYGADAGILTFRADDPKWSFVRITAGDIVTEVAEKLPISNLATVGIYWFRHGSIFVRAAMEMIQKDIRHNGEFYVAPVFNEIILDRGRVVLSVEIAPLLVHGLGTPEDLQKYERKYATSE